MCVFLCSVVGSALTFRITPNSQNLTAEDVAGKAGIYITKQKSTALILKHLLYITRCSLLSFCVSVCVCVPSVAEKKFLESETGLHVLQGGVGEVSVSEQVQK